MKNKFKSILIFVLGIVVGIVIVLAFQASKTTDVSSEGQADLLRGNYYEPYGGVLPNFYPTSDTRTSLSPTYDPYYSIGIMGGY